MAGAALVDVALLRPQAVVVDLVHDLGQEEAQPQTRQAGEAQRPAQPHSQAQDAVVGEGPDEPSVQSRLDRGRHEADVGADGDASGLLVDLDAVGTGHGLVVMGTLPFQAHVAVIVGGRPPDVELDRALQELAALRGQGHGQAGARVDGAPELVAVDLDPGPLTLDRQAGLTDGAVGERRDPAVASVGVAQGDLVEAQDVPGGQQRVGAREPVGDQQVAAPRGRDVRLAAQHDARVRRDGFEEVEVLAVHDDAVAAHLVGDAQVLGQVGVVEVVVDGEQALVLVVLDDAGGTLDILELGQAGVGDAVGRDEPVDAEVAVVDGLVVVAAVELDRPAVVAGPGGDRVVAPLPHEAAAHALVGPDDLPVVLEVAGAVAHGVAVLHEDEGLVRVGVQVVADLLDGRVHAAVQIDAGVVVAALGVAVVGALVVGQPRGVELLGPEERRLEGAAVGALVAGGPGDDAGAVLLAVDAQPHAVDGGLSPLRVVGDGLVPVLDLVVPGGVGQEPALGAVALVVGLGHDVEAVLVAQLVEARVVGVVGAAHRVDVVLLHQAQIPQHVLQVDDGPGSRVGVVPVDAAQGDGPAVEADDGVAHLDLADTHPVDDDLVGRGDDQGVEVGVLGAPQVGGLDGEPGAMGVAVVAGEGLQLTGSHHCAVVVDELDGGGDGAAPVGALDLDEGGGRPGVEAGADHWAERGGGDVVEQDGGRAAQEVDVAEDAAGAELVLVLQVGAVAPLEHQNGQAVGAGTDEPGHIELRGGVGDLAIADVGAVEPHVEAGVHTLKGQVGAGGRRVRGVLEVADVGAAGVVLGDVGRVEGDGVADVGVLVVVVAQVLPGTGHLNPGEALRDGSGAGLTAFVTGFRSVLLPEGLGEIVDTGQVAEGPLPAKQVEAVGVLSPPGAGGDGVGGRHVVGARRQCVLMEDVEVLEVSRNDHCSAPQGVDGNRGRAAVQRLCVDVNILNEISSREADLRTRF